MNGPLPPIDDRVSIMDNDDVIEWWTQWLPKFGCVGGGAYDAVDATRTLVRDYPFMAAEVLRALFDDALDSSREGQP